MLPWNTKVELADLHLPHGRVTVYDVQVVLVDSLLKLVATEDTWWRRAHSTTHHLSPALLELGAGFGGMGIGASFLGARPSLSIDITPLSIAHLQDNKHGIVIQQDLHDPKAAKHIHQNMAPRAHTACFGFPCQPYSTQGQGKHTADPRSHTLWAGLRVIWLTQCQAAILECVIGASYNTEVQQAIGPLAQAMQWDNLTTNLDLQEHWPCKRARWWTLLLPTEWNKAGLQHWGTDRTHSQVGSVLPSWGNWDEAAEAQLQLSTSEYQAYTNREYGADKRLLEQTDTCPTLLHSYSSATGPCPCKCRAQGFTQHSLRTKGLRGVFVISQTHGNPRFLHPREAAALLSVPENAHYAQDTRSSLALLGLIAAPIQMVWIYGSFSSPTYILPSILPPTSRKSKVNLDTPSPSQLHHLGL